MNGTKLLPTKLPSRQTIQNLELLKSNYNLIQNDINNKFLILRQYLNQKEIQLHNQSFQIYKNCINKLELIYKEIIMLRFQNMKKKKSRFSYFFFFWMKIVNLTKKTNL